MIESLTIELDVLAPAVEEVASICDMKTALSLVTHFGGCRIWVPQKWREGHELNIIGEREAKLLIERMGGGELNIPRRPFDAQGLHIMIARLAEAGKTQREIALSLGIAMKTVRDHIRKKGLRSVTKSGKSQIALDLGQLDLEEYLKNKA